VPPATRHLPPATKVVATWGQGGQVVRYSVSGNFKLSDILPQLTVPKVLWLLSSLYLMKSQKLSSVSQSHSCSLSLSFSASLSISFSCSLSRCVYVWLHISALEAQPHPSLRFGVAQFVSGQLDTRHWTLDSVAWTWT